ncbi:MAG: hypothetical protein C4K58_08115 [Flavobacteriaceae bacterium]|nr:MAG: hypothetical protein C4K58_08115 [Flavobacteriaceae bacterium]
MWNKLKNLFAGKESPSSPSPDDFSLGENSNSLEDPCIKFVKGFQSFGGNFVYCENKEEMHHALQNIVGLEKIDSFICFDPLLSKDLESLNIPFCQKISPLVRFNFITCESLIVKDGSILISSDQTSGFKASELPTHYVVLAKPSQLIDSLSDALTLIKRNKQNQLPTNITTLIGSDKYAMSSSQLKRTLYLLLLEED